MMVVNSFEMWQKDAFFSAAEEVQESADLMESTYRAWDRMRKESLDSHDLSELSRDLQTALGTAKWQLEEFEKAVMMSYGRYDDKNMTNRHGQFIAAIRDQIFRVEGELLESFPNGGNRTLQWVNLDKEECDDLALFLSGTSQCFQTPEYDSCKKQSQVPSKGIWSGDISDGKLSNDENNSMSEVEAKEIQGTRNEITCSGTRRMWSTPNTADWKIAIADEDEQRHRLIPDIMVTPKDRGSRILLSKQRGGERSAKSASALFNKLFGRGQMLQRQSLSPRHIQFGRSVRYMLILLLTIFLIVPFVFYST
ncbi:hypothetical protein SAY86_025706 [Trapa natans]|uniref:Syntaxin 6/10/61 N-terminal domain-containing protein n=1 Tax=Trapa natans TaxID=22666 RepID=A0AAN7KIH3_TRANT|nr:hypothetical protein SAY86_025706 [Trapa natans]